MANTTTSPNMSMPVPVVGTDPGPQWATDINSCLSILDGHNHSSGNGVQITPSGININVDLPFNNNNLTTARSLRLQTQSSLLALASDLGCLYRSGLDLFYNDGSGDQIRLTQSGGVAGSSGSIAGLASPASATFNAGSATFIWQSAANVAASLDARNIILRNSSVSSKGLTLSPPNAMGADYTITLPALPGANNFLAIDASGNVTTVAAVSGGITGAMIASQTVAAANIVNATITTSQISATAAIVGTQLSSSANILNSQIAIVNASQSSSCGSFTTTSATPADITNLSVNITTVGKPVVISLMSLDTGGNSGSINYAVPTGGGTQRLIITLRRADVGNLVSQFWGVQSGNSNMIMEYPAPGTFYIDPTPGAGTYTYKFQASVTQTAAGGSGAINNMVIRVYEQK